MTKIDEIGELLATRAPSIDKAEAQALARAHFGLDVTATPLTGERDSNFLLAGADGRHFVLKLGNPAEDQAVFDLQSRALQHLATTDPGLPVPLVVPARDGSWTVTIDGAAGPRVLRILTFLDGTPLHRAPRSPAQRRNLGAVLARLDLALQGFSHPAANHALMWDLRHAPSVRELFVHLPQGHNHRVPERFLDAFEAHALPALPQLRAQVIHNDLNPYNVLMRADAPDEVAGIIDFGDIVRAPLVQDLAVAAAYQLGGEGHPLAGAADVVAGYCACLPLDEAEVELLFDLIAARLVLIVAIGGWRAARQPENTAYTLRNNAAAWEGLTRLATLTREEAQAFLHATCRGAER